MGNSRVGGNEPEELEEVLKLLRELEPFGAGCRSVQEYMLLQLKRMNVKRPDVRTAICLLQEHFHDLRSCNLDKLRRQLGLEDDEIRIVLGLLAFLVWTKAMKQWPFAKPTEPSTVTSEQ